MTLIVVGSTVVDLILPDLRRLPTWPRHTEFTPSNLVVLRRAPLMTLGGNGANAAFVAARRGARVELTTTLGRDDLGRVAEQWLRVAGCKISPHRRAVRTAVNITAANGRHERATFFYPGSPVVLKAISPRRKDVRALLVAGWPHPPLETLANVFGPARRRGILTALDIGPLLGPASSLTALRPVLDGLALLLANQSEALKICRTTTLPAVWKKIRAHYAGDVVIKCGSAGAYWLPAGRTKPFQVTARKVRPVNTVGAGDTFNGALLAALLDGKNYPIALREATRVATAMVLSGSGVLGVHAKI